MEMNKSNLPHSCIVEFRNGERWLRIGRSNTLIGRVEDWEGWNTIEDYSEDLLYIGDDESCTELLDGEYDIMKVYEFENKLGYTYTRFLDEDYKCKLLWEREENKNKDLNDIKRRLDELTEMINEIRDEVDNC